MITVALAILAVLVGVVYWFTISTHNYWKKRGVLQIETTPFFGNIKESMLMQKSFNEVHQDLYHKFEGQPYAGIYHARRPILFIRDPELIKSILVRDFNHFHDRGITIHGDKYPLQQHLFSLPGYKWRVLRTKLSPTFTSGRMKNMYPLVEECSRNLVNILKKPAANQEIIEMKDMLAKFSTDVIGSCAFGLQMNALDNPDSEFRKMGKKVFEPSTLTKCSMVINNFMPEVGSVLKLDDFGRGVSDFFLRVVKETVDYRVKNNVTRNDFMQLLINLKYKGKIDDADSKPENEINGVNGETKDSLDFELDDGLLAAQAFVFFLAGFETSSTTMSFALYELAANPEVQRRLQTEVDAAIKADGGLTYDNVMTMKYLDKVVSETLRKYPPVMFLQREVSTPYTVPGTGLHLEKGLMAIIPVYALQRDPKYFPDPDTFDPERFSEEAKARRPHYAYLPFGEGPRNCIGMRFGLLQTKLGLAALLSKYTFSMCDKTEHPIRLNPKSVVTASTTGTIVRISNRA